MFFWQHKPKPVFGIVDTKIGLTDAPASYKAAMLKVEEQLPELEHVSGIETKTQVQLMLTVRHIINKLKIILPSGGSWTYLPYGYRWGNPGGGGCLIRDYDATDVLSDPGAALEFLERVNKGWLNEVSRHKFALAKRQAKAISGYKE